MLNTFGIIVLIVTFVIKITDIGTVGAGAPFWQLNNIKK
jgi:hypothetical protein